MKIESVKLSQIKTNGANPRRITDDKFNRLMDSILVFPKMLELRPVVVDGAMVALGGNQRKRALLAISKMTPGQVAQRLASLDDYRKKTEGERQKLIEWWGKWLESPFAYVINASTLSEEERKQFIIKDNVSFGTWDYDALANRWDEKRLCDWGMDVWNAVPQAYQPMQPAATNAQPRSATPPSSSEVDGKASGEPCVCDEMERIVVMFSKDQATALEKVFGIDLSNPKRGVTTSSLLIPNGNDDDGTYLFKFNDINF